MEWMLLPLKRYADFSGRSRRLEYWMFTLAVTIVYLVLFVGLMMFGDFRHQAGDPAGAGLFGMLGICVIFFLAILVPAIAVQVRRFHDQDKSGWLVLLNFIPYVGGLIVLAFMCLPGTQGANRFGPDPLDPAGTRDLSEVFR